MTVLLVLCFIGSMYRKGGTISPKAMCIYTMQVFYLCMVISSLFPGFTCACVSVFCTQADQKVIVHSCLKVKPGN